MFQGHSQLPRAREPLHGLDVTKFGAKSWNTSGKVYRGNISIRAIESLYSGHTDELKIWKDELDYVDQDAHSLVWRVMCEPKADDERREPFSLPGDSGSLIRNEDKELVGMLFGSQTSSSGQHASFFTSWTSIAHSFNQVEQTITALPKKMFEEEERRIETSRTMTIPILRFKRNVWASILDAVRDFFYPAGIN
jgi:hypothetical protein